MLKPARRWRMLAPCSPTVALGIGGCSVDCFPFSIHRSIAMQAYNSLEAYRAAKLAATDAKKAANDVIATEVTVTLPEHCDKKAIRKVFTQLAKANKRAVAVLEDLDGAAIFAEAETARIEKRKAKMIAESEALENAINARLDAIMADDHRRALLIMEAQAAEELAAQAAQSGNVEYVA
jgi:hypothetical protein